MANLVLQGASQCEFNSTFAVTATKIQVDGDQPVTVKFGAQGPIGSSTGAEKVTATVTLAVPITGLELDIVGALNSPAGFTFSFPIGDPATGEKHALFGCKRTKRSFSNTPESGDTEFTLSFTASEWVRIR